MTILFRGIPIELKFDRILKIESLDDLTYLQNNLLIDLSIKHNNTHKVKLPNPWKPSLLTVVNNLYQADFETFNYEMRTV